LNYFAQTSPYPLDLFYLFFLYTFWCSHCKRLFTSRQGKELARQNHLSDYEQLAEAIRDIKMCSDNPIMQATRCMGGGWELPDI
jgi:hypothetical protein